MLGLFLQESRSAPVLSKYTFAPPFCERLLSKCAALPGQGSALLPPGPALPREVPTLPRPSPALPPPGSASLCPDPALPCRGPALLRPRRGLLSQGLALFRPGPALLGPRPCRSIQDQIRYNGLCIHIICVYTYISAGPSKRVPPGCGEAVQSKVQQLPS